MKEPYIIWSEDLTINDVARVGGKNAALGEMVKNLVPLGVNVPGGFAVTAHAYEHFLEHSGLKEHMREILDTLNVHDITDLQKKGEQIRSLILSGTFSDELVSEVDTAYAKLVERYGDTLSVAVRSSATAEDLPGASFAGQQETYLNISGSEAVREAVKKCFASLFTNRAISYREDKGFEHLDVSLSVAVQKMVRSDKASSGVMFTIDTETGFDKVIVINSIYGLGELIVQGKVIPDEFTVFKSTLKEGKSGIIAHDIGAKEEQMIYSPDGQGGIIEPVPEEKRNTFSITDTEVEQLARWGVIIEDHFSKHHGRFQPMDIEWAKDGDTGELFIVQARPETVYTESDKNVYREFRLKDTSDILLEGIAVGTKIASGAVHVIHDVKDIGTFKKGEILVTEITDPDWEPIMKIASAIVTEKGGRTSHAAIVSRELGIPCIVGTKIATTALKDGDMITVDCSSGKTGIVYQGALAFDILEHRLDHIPQIKTKVMVNIGAPDEAFKHHQLPVSGVGLGRLEFIINSHIGIHPQALLEFESLKKDSSAVGVVARIEEKTRGYDDKTAFYVDELAEGIGKIAAAFYPNPVIVRFSDFKSNEYRTLIGGDRYEPEESNPMIGWRGASRYYDPKFKDAFGLECKAMKRVRGDMGLSNVIPMVPFCRTIEEGKRVLAVMEEYGLDKKKDATLHIYMMCEIPSNVILADAFLTLFDGMSIGSNDLTQLVLGLDRDSDIIAHIGNEKDEAVKEMIRRAIDAAKAQNKYIGICGQAPSDFPDFAEFLVEAGIDSMSLSPDTVLKTIGIVSEKEKSR